MTEKGVDVTVRMDAEVKAQAEELFEALGMDMSIAINMFVRQCLRERQLPFQPALNGPNKETVEALEEAKEMLRTGNFKRYTVDEAFEALAKEC